MSGIPDVWETVSKLGTCRHLAASELGAIQAHLRHFGVVFDKDVEAQSLGRVSEHAGRSDICWHPVHILAGLSR